MVLSGHTVSVVKLQFGIQKLRHQFVVFYSMRENSAVNAFKHNTGTSDYCLLAQ